MLIGIGRNVAKSDGFFYTALALELAFPVSAVDGILLVVLGFCCFG